MTTSAGRGLHDTSTVIMLPRLTSTDGLPAEPLDMWSRHERGILLHSPVLRQVERLDGWRIDRVRYTPTPVVETNGGGR